jgi:hypothetical protein
VHLRPSKNLMVIPRKSHTSIHGPAATPDTGGFHVMKLRFTIASARPRSFV